MLCKQALRQISEEWEKLLTTINHHLSKNYERHVATMQNTIDNPNTESEASQKSDRRNNLRSTLFKD